MDSMEGGTSLEVEGTDVVKIVLQFLKENQLTNTLLALQEEAQVRRGGPRQIRMCARQCCSGRSAHGARRRFRSTPWTT